MFDVFYFAALRSWFNYFLNQNLAKSISDHLRKLGKNFQRATSNCIKHRISNMGRKSKFLESKLKSLWALRSWNHKTFEVAIVVISFQVKAERPLHRHMSNSFYLGHKRWRDMSMIIAPSFMAVIKWLVDACLNIMTFVFLHSMQQSNIVWNYLAIFNHGIQRTSQHSTIWSKFKARISKFWKEIK